MEEQKGGLAVAAAILRTAIAQSLGQSYDGDRDIYTALGLKKSLKAEDLIQLFDRNGAGFRVATAYPNATWRTDPEIFEDEEKNDTQFEAAYKSLLQRVPLWRVAKRADIMQQIGAYSIMVFGFADGKKLNEALEPGKARDLAYVRAYREDNAQIAAWDEDTTSPRYGLPLAYKIKSTKAGTTGGAAPVEVHHSRVVHLAENALDNDATHNPLLVPVYNYCYLLDLVACGAAEAFWRGGFPGISFEADKDAVIDTTPEAKEARKAEYEAYLHGMKRYLSMHGITAKTLTPNIADPTGLKNFLQEMISAGTGIPRRIFAGSEAGSLASDQDEANFSTRVMERGTGHILPDVVRKSVDLIIRAGALPTPKNGYTAQWPETQRMKEDERADIAVKRASALASYVQSGASLVVPERQFVEEVLEMEWRGDEIDRLLDDEDGDGLEA